MAPVAGRLTALVLPFLVLEAVSDSSANGSAAELIAALYELDSGGVWHTLWLGLVPSTAATHAQSLFERRFGGKADEVQGRDRKPLVHLPTRPLALAESSRIRNAGMRSEWGVRDNAVLRSLKEVEEDGHAVE